MTNELSTPEDVPADVREQLRQLLEAGQLRDAIRVGSAVPQHARGGTLERDIVRWRIQAYAKGDAAAAPQWPPATAARVPEPIGIPEIGPDELTPERLAEGVLRHGCLLVRGLFDADEVARLKDGIDSAIKAHEDFEADPSGTTTSPWYERADPGESLQQKLSLSRCFVEAAHGVLTADSPRALALLDACFESHGIVPLLEAYFGERPALSLLKSTLRRVPASQSTTGWHQDGAFLGAGIRSMNLWLSLSDCGVDACGLDIVPRRFEHIIETGTGDAPFAWAASHEAVLEAAGPAGFVSPVFAPGDGLFFDHMLMHRTGLPPRRTRTRYAIESWFFAPSHYPMDQIPVWL